MAAVPAAPAASPRASVRVSMRFLLTIATGVPGIGSPIRRRPKHDGRSPLRVDRAATTTSGPRAGTAEKEARRARRSGAHGAEEAKDEAAPEDACPRQEGEAHPRGGAAVAPPP